MHTPSALILCTLVVGSYAIVCTPEMCAGVEQKELNCQGDLIPGGGFCGCSDICAGVDGDACELPNENSVHLLGVGRSTRCSSGYECVKSEVGDSHIFSPFSGKNGVCQKVQKDIPTTPRPLSRCEQTRRVRMISFAIWRGQWTPKCFSNGNFQPKQCDNTGACFCVTALEGKVLEGSKKQSQNVQC